MFRRLLLAWRALFGSSVASTDSPVTCARCHDLEADRNYWRAREERATEALLMREAGVAGVTSAFQSRANPVGAAIAALGKDSFDPKKTRSAPQPGQGAISGPN